MKWNQANKKYFEDKGYKFTKWKDVFMVNVNDLKPSTRRKIIAICDYCGEEYETVYASYCNSIKKNGKCCCKDCSGIKQTELSLNERQEKMYNNVVDICNRKNYKLLTLKSNLINNRSLIYFNCPIHGIQHKIYNCFIHHNNCEKCSRAMVGVKCRLTKEELIKGINSINNNTIINPEEYTDAYNVNLQIICGCCGEKYTTSWNAYTKGTTRCRHCSANESKGEFKIRQILEENDINFIPQYRFDDCKDKKPLPFDFYFPDKNECLEYDGEHHFMIWHSKEEFEEIKRRDEIKNKYCKNHNIKLIRIPYWEKNNLENVLKQNNIIR